MRCVRVLLVGMSGVLRGLVREVVAEEPSVAIVGESPDRSGASSAARRAQADVVILGMDEPETQDSVSLLLVDNPRLSVIGISSDGRDAFLHELRPSNVPLGELSPRALVEVIIAAGSRT